MRALNTRRLDDPVIYTDFNINVVIQDKIYLAVADFEYHREQSRWFEGRSPGYVEIISLRIDVSRPPFNQNLDLMDLHYSWLIDDQEAQLQDELMELADDYENELKLDAALSADEAGEAGRLTL